METKEIYLGITDSKWFNYLKECSKKGVQFNQINFWTPGKTNFKAIQPGQLFLFKLHLDRKNDVNGEIVGGAYFCGFEKMSLNEAWERFGEGNGASSLSEIRESVYAYKEKNKVELDDEIGCIILKDPFFLEEWVEEPSDWKKCIVRGKKYDTTTGEGKRLLEEVLKSKNNQ